MSSVDRSLTSRKTVAAANTGVSDSEDDLKSELLEQHSFKQRRGGMKSGPLCALMWRILTWCARRQVPQSSTHPRLFECDSRQTIQTRSDHSDRMVSLSRGPPSNMLQVAPAQSASVCHQVQQQTTTVCVTASAPLALAVEGLSLSWEDLDQYAYPLVAILGKMVKLQD